MINLYSQLNLSTNATTAEIEQAIRQAMQSRQIDDNILQAAQKYLLEPEIRSQYDAKLREEAPGFFAIPPKLPPQIQPTANATASQPDSADQRDDYIALLDHSNVPYYLRRFEAFDQAGKTFSTWHWPAFFIPFYWLLYRKMIGKAFAYLLLYVSLPIVLITAGLLGGSGAAGGAFWLWFFTASIIRLVWLPMRANALYYQHCQRKIAEVKTWNGSAEQQLAHLRRSPARSVPAVLIAAICIPLLLIPVMGILAAIALPAYQDYVARAQTSRAVSAIMAAQPLPGSSDANAPETILWRQKILADSMYLDNVQTNGNRRIKATFKSTAAHPLRGKPLFLIQQDDGTWLCGSEINNRLLPAQCRSTEP